MDHSDLWATLQATLLNDNVVRRAAEAHLVEVRQHGTSLRPRVSPFAAAARLLARAHFPFSAVQLSAVPGYLTALMHLSLNADISTSAKLSGATALRRAITRHQAWHSDEPSVPCTFSAAEKTLVRDNLVSTAVAQKELPVINAFADIASHVFRHDFPDRW